MKQQSEQPDREERGLEESYEHFFLDLSVDSGVGNQQEQEQEQEIELSLQKSKEDKVFEKVKYGFVFKTYNKEKADADGVELLPDPEKITDGLNPKEVELLNDNVSISIDVPRKDFVGKFDNISKRAKKFILSNKEAFTGGVSVKKLFELGFVVYLDEQGDGTTKFYLDVPKEKVTKRLKANGEVKKNQDDEKILNLNEHLNLDFDFFTSGDEPEKDIQAQKKWALKILKEHEKNVGPISLKEYDEFKKRYNDLIKKLKEIDIDTQVFFEIKNPPSSKNMFNLLDKVENIVANCDDKDKVFEALCGVSLSGYGVSENVAYNKMRHFRAFFMEESAQGVKKGMEVISEVSASDNIKGNVEELKNIKKVLAFKLATTELPQGVSFDKIVGDYAKVIENELKKIHPKQKIFKHKDLVVDILATYLLKNPDIVPGKKIDLESIDRILTFLMYVPDLSDEKKKVITNFLAVPSVFDGFVYKDSYGVKASEKNFVAFMNFVCFLPEKKEVLENMQEWEQSQIEDFFKYLKMSKQKVIKLGNDGINNDKELSIMSVDEDFVDFENSKKYKDIATRKKEEMEEVLKKREVDFKDIEGLCGFKSPGLFYRKLGQLEFFSGLGFFKYSNREKVADVFIEDSYSEDDVGSFDLNFFELLSKTKAFHVLGAINLYKINDDPLYSKVLLNYYRENDESKKAVEHFLKYFKKIKLSSDDVQDILREEKNIEEVLDAIKNICSRYMYADSVEIEALVENMMLSNFKLSLNQNSGIVCEGSCYEINYMVSKDLSRVKRYIDRSADYLFKKTAGLSSSDKKGKLVDVVYKKTTLISYKGLFKKQKNFGVLLPEREHLLSFFIEKKGIKEIDELTDIFLDKVYDFEFDMSQKKYLEKIEKIVKKDGVTLKEIVKEKVRLIFGEKSGLEVDSFSEENLSDLDRYLDDLSKAIPEKITSDIVKRLNNRYFGEVLGNSVLFSEIDAFDLKIKKVDEEINNLKIQMESELDEGDKDKDELFGKLREKILEKINLIYDGVYYVKDYEVNKDNFEEVIEFSDKAWRRVLNANEKQLTIVKDFLGFKDKAILSFQDRGSFDDYAVNNLSFLGEAQIAFVDKMVKVLKRKGDDASGKEFLKVLKKIYGPNFIIKLDKLSANDILDLRKYIFDSWDGIKSQAIEKSKLTLNKEITPEIKKIKLNIESLQKEVDEMEGKKAKLENIEGYFDLPDEDVGGVKSEKRKETIEKIKKIKKNLEEKIKGKKDELEKLKEQNPGLSEVDLGKKGKKAVDGVKSFFTSVLPDIDSLKENLIVGLESDEYLKLDMKMIDDILENVGESLNPLIKSFGGIPYVPELIQSYIGDIGKNILRKVEEVLNNLLPHIVNQINIARFYDLLIEKGVFTNFEMVMFLENAKDLKNDEFFEIIKQKINDKVSGKDKDLLDGFANTIKSDVKEFHPDKIMDGLDKAFVAEVKGLKKFLKEREFLQGFNFVTKGVINKAIEFGVNSLREKKDDNSKRIMSIIDTYEKDIFPEESLVVFEMSLFQNKNYLNLPEQIKLKVDSILEGSIIKLKQNLKQSSDWDDKIFKVTRGISNVLNSFSKLYELSGEFPIVKNVLLDYIALYRKELVNPDAVDLKDFLDKVKGFDFKIKKEVVFFTYVLESGLSLDGITKLFENKEAYEYINKKVLSQDENIQKILKKYSKHESFLDIIKIYKSEENLELIENVILNPVLLSSPSFVEYLSNEGESIDDKLNFVKRCSEGSFAKEISKNEGFLSLYIDFFKEQEFFNKIKALKSEKIVLYENLIEFYKQFKDVNGSFNAKDLFKQYVGSYLEKKADGSFDLEKLNKLSIMLKNVGKYEEFFSLRESLLDFRTSSKFEEDLWRDIDETLEKREELSSLKKEFEKVKGEFAAIEETFKPLQEKISYLNAKKDVEKLKKEKSIIENDISPKEKALLKELNKLGYKNFKSFEEDYNLIKINKDLDDSFKGNKINVDFGEKQKDIIKKYEKLKKQYETIRENKDKLVKILSSIEAKELFIYEYKEAKKDIPSYDDKASLNKAFEDIDKPFKEKSKEFEKIKVKFETKEKQLSKIKERYDDRNIVDLAEALSFDKSKIERIRKIQNLKNSKTDFFVNLRNGELDELDYESVFKSEGENKIDKEFILMLIESTLHSNENFKKVISKIQNNSAKFNIKNDYCLGFLNFVKENCGEEKYKEFLLKNPVDSIQFSLAIDFYEKIYSGGDNVKDNKTFLKFLELSKEMSPVELMAFVNQAKKDDIKNVIKKIEGKKLSYDGSVSASVIKKVIAKYHKNTEKNYEKDKQESLGEMKNVISNMGLTDIQKENLNNMMIMIDEMGYHDKYVCDDGSLESLCNLPNENLQKELMIVRKNLQRLTNLGEDSRAIMHQRLKFLALLRESARRSTSGSLFANYTQMYLLCASVMYGGRLLAGLPTGQGKSLISALLSAYYAGEGKEAFIGTTTNFLVDEAYEKFKDFYDFSGVSVERLDGESQPTEFNKNGCVKIGTVANIAFLIEKYKEQGIERDSEKSGLILDEQDMFLFDSMESYQQSSPSSFLIDQSERSFFIKTCYDLFKNDGLKAEDGSYSVEKIIEALEKAALSGNFSAESLNIIKNVWNNNIDNWKVLLSSIQAAQDLQEGVDFVSEKQKDGSYLAVPIVNHERAPDSRFLHYIQQFLHHKLNEETDKSYNITKFTKSGFIMSASSLIDEFSEGVFVGLTGTLGSDSEISHALSNNITSGLISFRGHKKSNRIDHESESYSSDKARIDAIIAQALKDYKAGRPVLIFSKGNHDSKKIYATMQEHPVLSSLVAKGEASLLLNNATGTTGMRSGKNGEGQEIPYKFFYDENGELLVDKERFDKYKEDGKLDENLIEKIAGNKGAFTIVTPSWQRGIDIQFSKEVHKKGGLATIVTFMAEERLMGQMLGRSGRGDKVGNTYRIYDVSSELQKEREIKIKSFVKVKEILKFDEDVIKKFNEEFKDNRNVKILILKDNEGSYHILERNNDNDFEDASKKVLPDMHTENYLKVYSDVYDYCLNNKRKYGRLDKNISTNYLSKLSKKKRNKILNPYVDRYLMDKGSKRMDTKYHLDASKRVEKQIEDYYKEKVIILKKSIVEDKIEELDLQIEQEENIIKSKQKELSETEKSIDKSLKENFSGDDALEKVKKEIEHLNKIQDSWVRGNERNIKKIKASIFHEVRQNAYNIINKHCSENETLKDKFKDVMGEIKDFLNIINIVVQEINDIPLDEYLKKFKKENIYSDGTWFSKEKYHKYYQQYKNVERVLKENKEIKQKFEKLKDAYSSEKTKSKGAVSKHIEEKNKYNKELIKYKEFLEGVKLIKDKEKEVKKLKKKKENIKKQGVKEESVSKTFEGAVSVVLNEKNITLLSIEETLKKAKDSFDKLSKKESREKFYLKEVSQKIYKGSDSVKDALQRKEAYQFYVAKNPPEDGSIKGNGIILVKNNKNFDAYIVVKGKALKHDDGKKVCVSSLFDVDEEGSEISKLDERLGRLNGRKSLKFNDFKSKKFRGLEKRIAIRLKDKDKKVKFHIKEKKDFKSKLTSSVVEKHFKKDFLMMSSIEALNFEPLVERLEKIQGLLYGDPKQKVKSFSGAVFSFLKRIDKKEVRRLEAVKELRKHIEEISLFKENAIKKIEGGRLDVKEKLNKITYLQKIAQRTLISHYQERLNMIIENLNKCGGKDKSIVEDFITFQIEVLGARHKGLIPFYKFNALNLNTLNNLSDSLLLDKVGEILKHDILDLRPEFSVGSNLATIKESKGLQEILKIMSLDVSGVEEFLVDVADFKDGNPKTLENVEKFASYNGPIKSLSGIERWKINLAIAMKTLYKDLTGKEFNLQEFEAMEMSDEKIKIIINCLPDVDVKKGYCEKFQVLFDANAMENIYKGLLDVREFFKFANMCDQFKKPEEQVLQKNIHFLNFKGDFYFASKEEQKKLYLSEVLSLVKLGKEIGGVDFSSESADGIVKEISEKIDEMLKDPDKIVEHSDNYKKFITFKSHLEFMQEAGIKISDDSVKKVLEKAKKAPSPPQ